MQEETKKYSELSFEEFITNILKFDLTEAQIHLVKLFEENKNKPIYYYEPFNPYPWKVYPSDDNDPLKPTVTYSTDTKSIDNLTLENGGTIK